MKTCGDCLNCTWADYYSYEDGDAYYYPICEKGYEISCEDQEACEEFR